MNKEFQEALPVIRRLKEHGYEAYFVGGSVRDALLGKKIKDVDIASSATPDQVRSLFSRTVDIGSEHGTMIVILNGLHYEVTTFRTEKAYKDNRRPSEVTFVSSLKEDLKRRDFTVNAMAMDEEGTIIDYFRGREHADLKVITTVGSPHERFSEDALRMLRAIRFVSQLEFTLSTDTLSSIRENAQLLSKISVERKTMEFEKIMAGRGSERALKLVADTGIYEHLPCLKTKKQQFLQLSGLPFHLLSANEERWTALIYVLKISETEQFLREWKLSNRQIEMIAKNILFLKERVNRKWTKQLLYESGLQCALQVEAVKNLIEGNVLSNEGRSELKALYQSLPIHSKNELEFGGTDLLQLSNQKPGPWMGELIKKIELAVVNDEVDNSKEAIKEMLKSCNLI
ncbi:CCA tRNA nucleotidyltransferase [Metabacillus idriensis]|uniref:CCA tRNA nucleotidyltransferase n=1 Tax=Metabacillus idriensis TaxID=324768 RepID=UPI00174DBE4B|nr:CCA tRNA nucleotidyltransferase [Metabacillus idriensis]